MSNTNGAAHEPRSRPIDELSQAQLQEQLRLVSAQVELTMRRQSQVMLESLSLLRDDDWPDPDNYIRLRTQDGAALREPLSIPSDRKHGDNYPVWRNETEHSWLRSRSRNLLEQNSFSQGLERNRRNYTIQDGFTYKAQAKALADLDTSKPGVQASKSIEALVHRAQDVIDRFLCCNRWNESIDPQRIRVITDTREHECYRRVNRDGEAFIRFFRDRETGLVSVRFVDPERIRQPPGGTEADGWSYGIRHRMEPFEDVESPLEYYVWHQDPSTAPKDADARDIGEFVAAEDILHVKAPGTDASIKRGKPHYIFDVAAALERAAVLQRNTSMSAAIRAATAEIWQMIGATQAQMAALSAGLSDTTVTDPATGRQENIERIRPGTIRRVSEGYNLVQPAADQSQSYLAATQGDLQQGSAASASPAYWLGDTINANYSNLETASAPPVLNGQTEQAFFKAAFAAVVWQAVVWAVRCGELPREALTYLDIVAEAPAVLHRNEFEDAQTRQIEAMNGVLSKQTWMAEKGRDPEIELANMNEWAAKAGAADQGQALPLPDDDEPPVATKSAVTEAEKGGQFKKGGGRVTGKGNAGNKKNDGKKAAEAPAAPGLLPDSTPRQARGDADAIPLHAHDTIKSLSTTERLAVKHYTGGGYKRLNAALRGETVLPLGPVGRVVDVKLQSAFGKAREFEKPVPVYRGMQLKQQDHDQLMSRLQQSLESGEPFVMKGYTSTSIDATNADSFSDRKSLTPVTFEIAAKKGLYVSLISSVGNERELLLDKNSKFKVVGIKEVPYQISVLDEPKMRRVVQLEHIT